MKSPSTSSAGPPPEERRGRIGWLRFAPLLLVTLIVAAMVWRLLNPPDTIVRSQMIGKPVPAFALAAAVPDKTGFTSADLAHGRPKLVHFFASWCVPCIGEAPVLDQLKQRGVAIEGIAVRDRSDDLARFLTANGDPFDRLGSDPESKTQLAFGSSGVPETFVVDGHGVIRLQHVGAIEPGEIDEVVSALGTAR